MRMVILSWLIGVLLAVAILVGLEIAYALWIEILSEQIDEQIYSGRVIN